MLNRCGYMNTIKTFLALLVIGAVLTSGCINNSETGKEQINKKFFEFKTQYENKKAQNYNVTESEDFAVKAKKFYDKNDYEKANDFLDKAYLALERAEKTPAVTLIPTARSTPNRSWLYEGAVFMEDFEPVRTFKNLSEIAPELEEIGIKTIEMLPIWEHPSSGNHFIRWAVRDYSKLDVERGNEKELLNFIAKAHELGIRIVPYVQITGTFAPSPVCRDRIIPGETAYYDKDGIGGDLYQYQIANPEKKILLKNRNGDFACLPPGYGFAVNQDSEDVIKKVEDIYKKQILDLGFDGIRLDASAINHCVEGEKIFYMRKSYPCPDPVTEKHSPIPLYKWLLNIKNQDQVFMAEVPYTGAIFSDYMSVYPYYPTYPDVDEVADVSEGYEFNSLLNDIIKNKITSSKFVSWINDQPILYNRQRFRMLRNWNILDKQSIEAIAKDPIYFPAVTLASTIPGIPKVTDYELFGNEVWEKSYKITVENTPEKRREHWRKVLNIRNNNTALKYGDISNVWKSGDRTFAYSRTYEEDSAVVILNFLNKDAKSTLDLFFLNKGTILHDKLSGENFIVNDQNNFEVNVSKYGSRILILKK